MGEKGGNSLVNNSRPSLDSQMELLDMDILPKHSHRTTPHKPSPDTADRQRFKALNTTPNVHILRCLRILYHEKEYQNRRAYEDTKFRKLTLRHQPQNVKVDIQKLVYARLESSNGIAMMKSPQAAHQGTLGWNDTRKNAIPAQNMTTAA